MEYYTPSKKRVRNKRKEKRKREADNRFTEITGIPIIKLTGPKAIDCWLVTAATTYRVPTRKIAYACFNDWQTMDMARTAKKMKLLRVKQSCGVDQCVNPDHLVGIEKEIDPAKGWRTS